MGDISQSDVVLCTITAFDWAFGFHPLNTVHESEHTPIVSEGSRILPERPRDYKEI